MRLSSTKFQGKLSDASKRAIAELSLEGIGAGDNLRNDMALMDKGLITEREFLRGSSPEPAKFLDIF
jgi:hypothetical protein